ncbi:MAG: hypothetical protein Q9217_004605 [Psora testacea]
MSEGDPTHAFLADFSLHARRTLPPPLPSPRNPHYHCHSNYPYSNTIIPNISPSSDATRSQSIDHLSPQQAYPDFPSASAGSPNESTQECEPNTAITARLEPRTEHETLRSRIQILEAQIEDLHNTIYEIQQQAAAKDAQYSQIIDRATELEQRSMAESQQRRAEREEWEREKVEMLQTITDLRALVPNPGSGVAGRARSEAESSLLRGDMVMHGGGSERALAPRRVSDVSMPAHSSTTWDEIRQESKLLNEYSAKLVEIGENVRKHLDDLVSMP